MGYKITRVDIYTLKLEDRPGGLAEKLEPLSKGKHNCDFMLARRAEPGTGVLYLSLSKNPAKAVKAAGLSKDPQLFALRIDGADKPGLSAKVARIIGDAGISMRGLNGVVLGKKCVIHVSFTSQGDADKARKLLKKGL